MNDFFEKKLIEVLDKINDNLVKLVDINEKMLNLNDEYVEIERENYAHGH